MAAYAAVVSLMNTVESIHTHPRHSVSLDKKQIESLGEKVGFLEEFLEKHSHYGSSEVEALERQIAYKVHAAEDVIESHIVDQIHAGLISLLDLQPIIEDMDSLKEKIRELQEEGAFEAQQTTFSSSANSSTPLITNEKSKMVGCDEELIGLMDVLTGHQSSRKIIPIVGMGGIGKTMLAKNVYENSLIVQYFDVRLWATLSQEYSLREILLELSCQLKSNSGDYELGEQLYKSLCGRRYLMVLDDMWSIKAWDEIKLFLPENNNGSRIVVMTRQSNLATHFGSTCLFKKFLDENASWKLFCEKAFGEEGCPLELEATGKKIAEKCKGLPLSIVVICGLLGKSTRAREYWENIAKDINAVLNSTDEDQCFNILLLSYRCLPAPLKPCFLYMGIFQEDDEIHISKLIKLWVAEGFLKSKEARSLEEIAEGHFTDLVDRNLILVRRVRLSGKIKTCFIHDLVRDLCLRVAEKEKFICVLRSKDTQRGIVMARRIVCHERIESRVFHALQAAAPLARTLVCREDMPLSSEFRLLRVLSVVYVNDDPEAHFQQVNLRYLTNSFDYFLQASNLTLPPSMFTFWNVQTLIFKVSSPVVAPSEIWDMTQLRHLVFNKISLPDPPSHGAGQQDICFILGNLQTIHTVVNFRLSVEVCKRIPNLKKLKIDYANDFSSSYCLFNLGCLRKLESLSLSFGSQLNRGDLRQNLMLPDSLKKLFIFNSNLHWEDLTMIGSLPHLEVLKLGGWWSVKGHEWSPVEGEFLRLKFLKIEGCRDLISWNACSSHFPVLENLTIEGSHNLDGIPSGVGEIPTLKFIHLFDCSESSAISAVRILEQQDNLGNDGLQVQLKFWDEADLKSFREMIEQELKSFTSNSLQLESFFC